VFLCVLCVLNFFFKIVIPQVTLNKDNIIILENIGMQVEIEGCRKYLLEKQNKEVSTSIGFRPVAI